MGSIFLSHSHEDKTFARKLAGDLRKEGHAVWIDEAEINIGDSLIEKIREGLDSVDYVAAILSTSSINSNWVTKELDLASNREIEENRVVVLPLMFEQVDLPGFLKGKYYGDFTSIEKYDGSFKLLLRKLGKSDKPENVDLEEINRLKAELQDALNVAKQHKQAMRAHEKTILKDKPPELVEAIQKANANFPLHAPINISHAFSMGGSHITLDYLLWCIAKSERRGGHPIEMLLTIENKWPNVERMLEAYSSLLEEYES